MPPGAIADKIYAADSLVRIEDLEWPTFDPERASTMPAYLGEIGVRMADRPRESTTTDSALGVYGADFLKAEPRRLIPGLYEHFKKGRRGRVRKPFIRPMTWHTDLSVDKNPGLQPFSAAVAVDEELYNLIIHSPAGQSDRIANRTEKANGNGNVEGSEDLGGESAFYPLADRHLELEEIMNLLKADRTDLVAVRRSVLAPQPKRIANLEIYRTGALADIQKMVRVACKGLGYGTNDTKNTLVAVASNIHRSELKAKWLADYALMGIYYNDAVSGKIDQTIHGILEEMPQWVPHLINNVDREYTK